MKEKKTSKKGSRKATESTLRSKTMKTEADPDVTIYYGNHCLTKYWIWNEEHNCIAYGKITD